MRWLVLSLVGGCAPWVWNQQTFDCSDVSRIEYNANSSVPLELVTETEIVDASCVVKTYGIRNSFRRQDRTTIKVEDVSLTVLEYQAATFPNRFPQLRAEWQPKDDPAEWSGRANSLVNLSEYGEIRGLYVEADGDGHVDYTPEDQLEIRCEDCTVAVHTAVDLLLNVGGRGLAGAPDCASPEAPNGYCPTFDEPTEHVVCVDPSVASVELRGGVVGVDLYLLDGAAPMVSGDVTTVFYTPGEAVPAVCTQGVMCGEIDPELTSPCP